MEPSNRASAAAAAFTAGSHTRSRGRVLRPQQSSEARDAYDLPVRLWLLARALFGLLLAATSSVAAQGPSELRAFVRAKQATDVLPTRVRPWARVGDSRRIATYLDGRKRPAAVYIVKRGGDQFCLVTISTNRAGRHWSGSCSPRALFFPRGEHVAAASGRLFTGVVTNEVRHVVVIGSRGRRHPVRVTSDGGFIFDCHAWNGCACVVAAVEARDAQKRLLSTQAWPIAAPCRR